MSASMITAQQLRSIVEEQWEKDKDALAFGLHVAGTWEGPTDVQFTNWNAGVVSAQTVLQVREALQQAESRKQHIIVVTSLRESDLGHDVVARLAKWRLFPVDHWASLRALFRAKQIDQSICEPAIAHALLEHAPVDGYPPVSTGILDAATVWRAVSRHVFAMGEREPDLPALLVWACSTPGAQRYREANDELRTSLTKRLTERLGDGAAVVLGFVDHARPGDAIALSAVCEVIFGTGADDAVDEAAAARLEQFNGNTPIDRRMGQTLARAVAEVMVDLDRPQHDPRDAGRHMDRADELVRKLRCQEHAYRSGLTRFGYEQRLARFGQAVVSALEAPALTDEHIKVCEGLLEVVSAHRLARLDRPKERAQRQRTEMAVRLLRWLSQPVEVPTDFDSLVSAYVRDISFVDWARESVCWGEEVSELSAAYERLDAAIVAARESFNEAFARGLVDWSSAGSAGASVIGVEQVLDLIVAKAANTYGGVLLIVLDGMSWAVCHELLEDVHRDQWYEATLDEQFAPPPAVVAAIPSMTTFSRTSLLSGAMVEGDSSVEKRNFGRHPGLSSVCEKRFPPVLFHKGELTQQGRGRALAEPVEAAVMSPDQRVVGMVINAVDDRMPTAPQIRNEWSLNGIAPLARILKLARDAGRVVILTSDHGHVWHRGDAGSGPIEGGGGRWRATTGPALVSGEVLVSGPRVMLEGNSAIVPWSEAVHYGRQRNGYHGGVSPQEMLCPLVILTDRSAEYPADVRECDYTRPRWWSGTHPTTDSETAVERVTVPAKRATTLFDQLEPPTPDEGGTATPARVSAGGWVDKLLSSEVYKEQKALVRRHAPDDAQVRACLKALDDGGGMLTPAALAKVADLPAVRLDGLVAKMQRLLNIDGYEILGFNRGENRVELNVAKLRSQFDLG